ncbi:hypothetical protein ACH5RR_006708 [Cinchona calisaya]|uniref:Uncharacterized protein n=1 Tax=Cinchona calisaya TaxID=153742 RepID=A0ABD3AQ33_9GENT
MKRKDSVSIMVKSFSYHFWAMILPRQKSYCHSIFMLNDGTTFQIMSPALWIPLTKSLLHRHSHLNILSPHCCCLSIPSSLSFCLHTTQPHITNYTCPQDLYVVL